MRCHAEAALEAKYKDLIAFLCKNIIKGYTIQVAVRYSAAYHRVFWVPLLILHHAFHNLTFMGLRIVIIF
jgi:hypothetical protein